MEHELERREKKARRDLARQTGAPKSPASSSNLIITSGKDSVARKDRAASSSHHTIGPAEASPTAKSRPTGRPSGSRCVKLSEARKPFLLVMIL